VRLLNRSYETLKGVLDSDYLPTRRDVIDNCNHFNHLADDVGGNDLQSHLTKQSSIQYRCENLSIAPYVIVRWLVSISRRELST
jgi:hypothetical protein